MTSQKSTSDKPGAGKKILAEKTSEDYSLRLELNHEESECWLIFEKKTDKAVMEPEELKQALTDANIPSEYINNNRIKVFCDVVRRGENPGKTVVAAGKHMLPGRNGWLELKVSATTEEAHFESDERDTIDYRHRRAIANVKADDRVGKIHPPGSGAPGITVFGDVIPAKPGLPLQFVAGDGIRLDDDGVTPVVVTQGRLLYDGKTLSVTDEFFVPSDVNFSVGHIEFLGFVNVAGDVLDGFNIKATRGIEVGGVVGECHLIAGGDISISSMFGRGTGTIRCTGDLRANLLIGVNVECHGDVIVVAEIRDSEINCLGKITIESGTIGGGECKALRGVEAKTLGCKSGTRTIIRSGVNFLLEDEDGRRQLQARLHQANKELEEKEKSISMLEQHVETTEVESVKTRLNLLKKRVKKVKLEKELLDERMRFYEFQDDVEPMSRVNCHVEIFEGVVVILNNMEKFYLEKTAGPVSIINDRLGNGLVEIKMSPLADEAVTLTEEQVHEIISEDES